MQDDDIIDRRPAPLSAARTDTAMTLAAALRLFRADLLRRFQLREQRVTGWNVLRAFLQPGVVGVFLLRLGNWLHAKNRRIGFRLVERLIFLVTRNELQPGSCIGPGLVLADEGMVGITSSARLGSNCTLFSLATIIPQVGGAVDTVIGDNCVIGRRVRVYGAIVLANGTQIKDNSVVLTSFQRPGTILSGIPARRRGQVPLDVVKSWNPILGRPMNAPDGSVGP